MRIIHDPIHLTTTTGERMTSRDFCYWLQGFFELDALTSNHPDKPTLSVEQVKCITNHLNMVFYHEIDPAFGDKKHTEILSKIHLGTGGGGGGPMINC